MQESMKFRQSSFIIGVVDSGIWESHKCFLSVDGDNLKVVHTKVFLDSHKTESCMDYLGHGTKCASIAVGSCVETTGDGGFKLGIAKGGAPLIRIAVYKVVHRDESLGNVRAAFEEAVKDEVNIISCSLGIKDFEWRKPPALPCDFMRNPFAKSSLFAVLKDVLPCMAAGDRTKVINVAPWELCVGASTAPCVYTTKIVLSTGHSFMGRSLNSLDDTDFFQLLDSREAESWVVEAVRGFAARKILVHDVEYGRGRREQTTVEHEILFASSVAREYCAEGLIIIVDDINSMSATQTFPLPGVVVSRDDGQTIIRLGKDGATAQICKSEQDINDDHPAVAPFSATGNSFLDYFIKPDLCAVGVDIIAADTVRDEYGEAYKQESRYVLTSGTSMAVSAVASRGITVLCDHPNLSASALKSALMTTSTKMFSRTAAELDLAGSGLVNPGGALNPGLVYDLKPTDHLALLRGLGWSTTDLMPFARLIGDESQRRLHPMNYNYPSFKCPLPYLNTQRIFERKVRHIGRGASCYKSSIMRDGGLEVAVEPEELTFDVEGEEKDFILKVKATSWMSGGVLRGRLIWKSDKYTVRSPIVVTKSSFGEL